MRQFLILILIVFSISSYAQVKDSTESKKKTVQDFKNMMSPYYSYGNGLGITSPDSLYQVNIRFRMQNRISYNHDEGEEDNIDGCCDIKEPEQTPQTPVGSEVPYLETPDYIEVKEEQQKNINENNYRKNLK